MSYSAHTYISIRTIYCLELQFNQIETIFQFGSHYFLNEVINCLCGAIKCSFFVMNYISIAKLLLIVTGVILFPPIILSKEQ